MKLSNRILLFAVLLFQSLSFAGKESGGGNPYLSDFRNRARYIVHQLPKDFFSTEDFAKFKRFVETAQPIAASGRLFHAQKGEVIAKVVYNDILTKEDLASLNPTTIEWLMSQESTKRFLLINTGLWAEIVTGVVKGLNTIDLLQFVFHEYLQLSGFDDAHDEISSKLRLSESGYQKWKSVNSAVVTTPKVAVTILHTEVLLGEAIEIGEAAKVTGTLDTVKNLALISHAERCKMWKESNAFLYGSRIKHQKCGTAFIKDETSFSTVVFGNPQPVVIWAESFSELILDPDIDERRVYVELKSQPIVIKTISEKQDIPLYLSLIKTWNSSCDAWKADVIKNAKVTPLYLGCGHNYMNHNWSKVDNTSVQFFIKSIGTVIY